MPATRRTSQKPEKTTSSNCSRKLGDMDLWLTGITVPVFRSVPQTSAVPVRL